MDYLAKAGQLSMHSEVFIRIAHEEGPPTEVRSGSATASRPEAILRFVGEVLVTRGEEALTAQRLTLNLSPDLAFVYRAVAVDDMELRTGGAGRARAALSLGGMPPGSFAATSSTPWFDEDTHKIHEAMAGPKASLDRRRQGR